MDNEKFGKFVCKMRQEKGMTQQDLGNKLHLTNKAISKWERGLSFPDICILQKVAQALDVSVLELLNGEKNTEIDISNEVANRIIEDTVSHSGNLIKKIKRKLTITLGLFAGLLPLSLAIFSCACFYFIEKEKTLDDALLTLIFIIIGAILAFLFFGVPILGLVFTKIWFNSHFMSKYYENKKAICTISYLVFATWLSIAIIRLII